uniref:Uncharacterized protein n=1 Tax=Rhizophora mucronata TaxID=61149 RepID=A0A2P2PRH1_RHIMU
MMDLYCLSFNAMSDLSLDGLINSLVVKIFAIYGI